jgi:hypothetical protein
MVQTTIQSTTQKFLDIFDITNDILILKNGSTSIVITVNAMNFGLLAEPEQDAIMYAYAGLLNSLNYPIQVVIRSQTKDVTSYLHLLEEEEQKATVAVKKNWINNYRHFVANLIKERNVLDKKFYVVVSASALEMGLLPPSTVIPGVKQPDLSTIERSVILDKAQEILEPRRDHMLAQLGRIGLAGRQLSTQEIIQLFYLSYNPEAAEGQQITNTSSYTTPLVEASMQGGIMNAADQPTTGMPGADSATPDAAAPSKPLPTVPSDTGASPAAMPPISPASPATPGVTPPPAATPASGSVPPTISTPTMGGAPASTPSATPPPADSAQNEIDSTLKQIGNTPGTPPTPTPGMPAATPPAPAAVPPAPGSTANVGTPPATGETMPPLPEI